MVKFFRHIRQRLLSESKFSEYLLYAIGEIVLVVIGILIALQINTWKTEAENKGIEHEYYCQLVDDLELDKRQLVELSSKSKERIELGKQLIKDLHTLKNDKDELLANFLKTARANRFVPTKAAYTDLTSSGHLSLISDKELKKNLFEYYAELDNITIILQANNALRAGHMTDWDDVLEFGWQSPGISPGLELDDEIMDLLPKNQWHLDKNSTYFKKFQEVVFICIIISDRELELYNVILDNMNLLYQELEEAC